MADEFVLPIHPPVALFPVPCIRDACPRAICTSSAGAVRLARRRDLALTQHTP